MKTAVALLAALLLVGCGTTDFVRKEVVVETRYVIRKASEAQKQLPPMPAKIDPQSATQLELAEWMAQTEKRMMDLESLIKQLIVFYEKLPTEEEKKVVEPEKK